jgi:imidazolonepropionase-like amidohydrolase
VVDRHAARDLSRRDLGRLDAGAEASFLVLSGDPLADFAHAHDIAMWVKQGYRLEPPVTPFPPLQPSG